MESKDEPTSVGVTEWTCSYCPSVATTIRQGSAVCYHHAEQLRIKVGLAVNPIPNGSVSTVRAWPQRFGKGQRSAASIGHSLGREIGQLGCSADYSRNRLAQTCPSADRSVIAGEILEPSLAEGSRMFCRFGERGPHLSRFEYPAREHHSMFQT